MQTIDINLQSAYTIYIGGNLLNDPLLLNFCKKQANTIVIIVDDNLRDLYGAPLLRAFQKENIEIYLLPFTSSEINKTREVKQQLEDQMFQLGCGRDTCIIAIGGGITTDIAGFIASTYCRGIPVVYIPTSLLAMVDASIGGKTGVNTPFGKNLVGTFYQPKAVFIDTSVLTNLPLDEFKNGMAEVIKHALIADEAFFQFLEDKADIIKQHDASALENIIATSCRIKGHIVQQDEKEKGMRQLLNFGHTVGHALEKASDYQLSHGRAVAIGLIVESYMSMKLKFLDEHSFKRIQSIFRKYDISPALEGNYTEEKIKKALLMDKKTFAHQTRFVLIDAIGKPHLSTSGYTMVIPHEILDDGLRFLFSMEETIC